MKHPQVLTTQIWKEIVSINTGRTTERWQVKIFTIYYELEHNSNISQCGK